MTQDSEVTEVELERPSLKVVEPEVDPDRIWCDDKLERKKIAKRLTAIIEDQEAPFVISLDGRWGTGKTFLLKRWQAQLEEDEFQAIYFNAWEDDFCDDPLLAIIGQLSEHFDDGTFKDVALRIANFGVGLLTKQLTGTAVDVTDFKPESILDEYHEQRRTKEKMKTELRALAKQVKQDSGKPLVFIIDELDRCRPTFAIELLERVKHIFDVDNIVFVFGINRSELVKSLESVYGKIDAGVYLRRFFDMEFILPDANPVKFCAFLMNQYGLSSFFNGLSKSQASPFHAQELRSLSETLPVVLGRMGLSLRDMDYCVRLVCLAVKKLKERYTVYPAVLALLVAVKLSNPELYQRFVIGMARGADIIDFMNERHRSHGSGEPDPNRRDLEWVEAGIYFADNREAVWEQLTRLSEGEPLTRPELLDKATREMNLEEKNSSRKLRNLQDGLRWFSQQEVDYEGSVGYLVELIDLYERSVRR